MTSTADPAVKGNIFDIQGLSVHDGPGCRTLVFIKGCTLRCSWCSNPEGINQHPDVLYSISKCILCGNCVKNCPHQAIQIQNEIHSINRHLCNDCQTHECVKDCLTESLRICGYEISVDEIMEIIRRDRQFWGANGGITLTGGEPLLQVDFAAKILESCYNAYIHTAIETCGNVSWEHFEKVLPWLDWIFFDLKHVNNEEHKIATGAGNSLILENLRRLAKHFTGRLILRLPLISGFNDDVQNIEAVISLMLENKVSEINILPLHHLGREKYELLGKEYFGRRFTIPTNDRMKEIQEKFRAIGLTCYLGGDTGF